MALQMIVSPFLRVVLSKLSSLIASESRLLSGVRKDLEKLSNTLSVIQTVLVDAEAKQINDQRARDWLSKLKDAGYDAEDVLDECEYEGLQQESDVDNCTKQVSDSLSACFDFKQIIFRHKMGKKIRELIKKFGEIDAEKSMFQLNPGVPVIADEGLGHGQEAGNIVTEPKIYGRDADKKAIVQILLDNSKSSKDLSIYPITGIGGLGKTTLAQLVYHDKEVVRQFYTRIWVCVSKDFSVKRITKMIIDHLTEKKCNLEDLSPMQNLLKKLLYGRKYLLVLDDVWDDKQGNWNDIIMCLLACGAKGSSIIVTTRLRTVVSAIPPLSASCVIVPASDLKCLTPHDSWSLFQHYALGVGDKENEDLIAIGKVVVAKCKGIPLAIKAVGSLLKSKREEFWRLIRDSEIWHLEEHGENTIFPALRLSYYHLPPVYRQCFAYCSVYPKDWPMRKERLIHGWMANGFIQSSRGVEAEDVGEDIFNGLLQRSFFQDESTKIVSCKIHDLLHDLACSVAKNECPRMKTCEIDDFSQRVRHVSVACNSPFPLKSLNPMVKSQLYIHTLLFLFFPGENLSGLDLCLSHSRRLKHLRVLDLGHLWNLNSLPPWIGQLRLLKWLDLENTGIALLPEIVFRLTNLQVLLLGRNPKLTTLPSSVGKLKNLRCLDLSATSVKELPRSISTLTNLQTLKLEFCPKLEMLPSDLKNMKSLRNLLITWEFGSNSLLSGMPVGIGDLTHLERLQLFVVSNTSEGAAGIQELGRLNNLKGGLLIKGIRHVHDSRDADEANLKNKSKLSQLFLFWGSSEDGSVDTENEEEKKTGNQVLKALEPHRNIQRLEIRDYPGVELPGWVGNCALTLPHLRKLELFYMPNAVHDLHQLSPNLKKLWIVGCPKLLLHPELKFPSSIKELSVAAWNDPSLSSLKTLPLLSELQIDGYHFESTLPGAPLRNLTCLRKLWITDCSNVKNLLPEIKNIAKTLRKLQISWCLDLDCMTEEGLRNLASLGTLTFYGCWGLTSLSGSPSSLQHLTSLTSLLLSNCPKLELSTLGFQHLVTLKLLRLEELPQMTFLPDDIQHITTLQILFIRKCKNLGMLPEWLQQRLPPSLYYLQIRECDPKLHKRCEMNKGEDWHKISHLQLNTME